MNAPVRLAGFAATLAVVFGGAALAGAAIDPSPARPEPAEAGGHGDGMSEAAMSPVRGLATAERGMRLVVDDADVRRGRTAQLRFRIVGDDGATVRDFEVEHTKRMHFIVVRRDLTGFQHLHPVQAADGSWSTPLRLDGAGSYRVFADFSRGGVPTTLGADLRVDGAADLRPLPPVATSAVSDLGDDVRLDAGRARAGRPATLRFAISKGGQPVVVEPYLGADGHLVALRDGDLGYLHVHPDHGGYEVTFPTEGRYRLFLQFKDAGRVHTVAFTQEVAR
jgi:hypothetical protein